MPAPVKGIQGKRAASRISNLKKRHEAGEDVSGQRGYIRVGAATTAVLVGADDLSEWDEEELRRGRRRTPAGRKGAGTFIGPDPVVVPKAVHDEMRRRTLREAQSILTDSLLPGLQYLRGMIEDDTIDPAVKLRAVAMIMDRVLGKTPEKVELTAEVPPWMEALTEGIVSLDDEAKEGHVIDVEEVVGDDAIESQLPVKRSRRTAK
jgi:hypothetical protein